MKGMTRALPLLGGLALVGTAVGVSLGHSAVSEINPLYFAEAPARFHSELVPNQPNWSAPAAPLTVAAISAEGLGTGCFGCAPARAEVYAAPAVVTYTDSWIADARAAAAPVEAAPVEAIAPDPERERVVRYATYPVYAEQPQALAQAPEAETAEPEAYAAAEFVTE
ncbi:MAG TPA: hypothetical protein VGB70_06200 [Allosphingosinicella sp.]|jgi:hypothetical protein